jgi:hypothetical protein
VRPRADTCVFLDEVPTLRVNKMTTVDGRIAVTIDPVLTIFGPANVMRATLTAALTLLDALADQAPDGMNDAPAG